MDTEALKAFVNVVNESSFSKAATRLNITQPAITKRIQSLERSLSAQLIERLQREIVLTESGKALYPHALAVLHEIDNARQAIESLNQNIEGELRIVASHHIGLHRLPRILQRFSKEYPDVDLKLNFLDSESAYPLLIDNQADIAFITIPNDLKKEFTCHIIWDDKMSFVSSIDHPLSTLNTVEPVHLSEHNAILPSESTLTYRVVESIFNHYQLSLNANIPTNYLETMKMMTAVGMGWSVLPDTMIDEELKVLPVSIYDSASQNSNISKKLVRQLGSVSYRKKSLSKSAEAFIDVAKSVWGDDGD